MNNDEKKTQEELSRANAHEEAEHKYLLQRKDAWVRKVLERLESIGWPPSIFHV